MKIKRIEYQNFRQFAKKGYLDFNTDGKINIVYGNNGDGKTTFHQLFRWILFGEVKFNKTTNSDKLYNLKNGKNLMEGSDLVVWGQILYEHDEKQYLVRREWTYKKLNNGEIVRKTENDKFFVCIQLDNKDWKTLDEPELVLEKALPRGLASYFFFDGETMIADLKMRGTESAKTLRSALYSRFDLEAYENAIKDIGNINKISSALGALRKEHDKILQKSINNEDFNRYMLDIVRANRLIEKNDKEITELKEANNNSQQRINNINIEIGEKKSRTALEKSRSREKTNIKHYEEDLVKKLLEFGDIVETSYSNLLIAEAVNEAKQRIYLKVQDENKKTIPGLTKELIVNLCRSKEIKTCICGREIGKDELLCFEDWKKLFPPASYKSTYDKFCINAERFIRSFDDTLLESSIKSVVDIKNRIKDSDEFISNIEEQLKNTGDIDSLIDERNELEKSILSNHKKIENLVSVNAKTARARDIRQKKVDEYKVIGAGTDEFDYKIGLLQQVAESIKSDLKNQTIDYSKDLKNEIQYLIDNMLTSKRKVVLTEDFQLKVSDSYGDESKSEGQFAVVSFAYIGGILKVLSEHDKLYHKTFPLVLDGPFSKLDIEQKSNVLKYVPLYAPQVIIFSKDPLHDFISDDMIGNVWTIISNDERNYAEIKEGTLWN